jgi:hypothetical protein
LVSIVHLLLHRVCATFFEEHLLYEAEEFSPEVGEFHWKKRKKDPRNACLYAWPKQFCLSAWL